MLSARGIIKNKGIYLLAKSDRINALRKQYDAFLEEDKKRKERNDFILGRLDKMRYTTALVQVRRKPSAFDTRPALVDRLGFQPEFSSVRDFQSSNTNQRQLFPDIQINNNEDTYLIQEISKKYILIPKLRTPLMNNCIMNGTTNQNPERSQEVHLDQDTIPIKDLKPNSHDNTDWKSKYEILNILKNEEKGKTTGNYQTDFVDLKQSVPKESSLGNNQDQVAINYDNYVNTDVRVETPIKYVNEFPERDLPADTLHYDLPKDSEYSLNNTVRASEDLVANVDTSENNNIFVVNQTDAIGDQLQNITLESKKSDPPNIDISREVTDYHKPQPEPDVNMTSMTADLCLKQISNINEENIYIQDEHPVEAGSLIHGQNESVEQYETADSEQVVYVDKISPMQALTNNAPSTLDVNDRIFENENSAIVSNDQEFAPNIDVQMKSDTIEIPQEQTYINSNIETAEEAEPGMETDQVNITESIEDFDNEQREMFYTDQTDENYPTQNVDMAHPLDFPQNEYPQNQEYTYYENTAGEAYPGELNNEDVTQQYDPNYEQQYAGLDQRSEQQQYVEQYQEPERFTEHQGSEQQQYFEQYQEPERFTDQVKYEELGYEKQFESQGPKEGTLGVEDGSTAPKSAAAAVEMPPGAKPIETDEADGKTVSQTVTNTYEQVKS